MAWRNRNQLAVGCDEKMGRNSIYVIGDLADANDTESA